MKKSFKNDVVKKTLCEKLVAKVNNIDTSALFLKTRYQTDKTELGKKIPDVTNFVKKTKLTELENKIPVVSSLATKTALRAAENKIPDVSSLVKKTNYNTEVSKLEQKLTNHNHEKNIITPEFNTLAANAFSTKLAQANLVTKTDFDTKLSSVNRKTTSNKSKHLLIENELKKLKTFDLSYFIDKIPFGEDGVQNYLAIQLMYRCFKRIAGNGNGNYIRYWQPKGLTD